MGINGKVLTGNGILVNLYYLSQEQFDFLGYLIEKYPDICEYDRINGLFRQDWILIWGEQPFTLFSGLGGRRRPLILNSETQAELMSPLTNSINFNNKELWEPSYRPFYIQLEDYSDPNLKQGFIDYWAGQGYQAGEKYQNSAYPWNQKYALEEEEIQSMTNILLDPRYILAGKWLIYTLF